MFNNIGEKIRWLAKITFILSLILALVFFILCCVAGNVGYAFLLLFAIVIAGYISAMFTYGLGELIDNTSELKEDNEAIKNEIRNIKQILKDMQ